ncbi:hypothetical protein [Oculatella sp. LEGE 06141]|nr:hypothetical protein [Oculatella sp. LEGE 06141]
MRNKIPYQSGAKVSQSATDNATDEKKLMPTPLQLRHRQLKWSR